MIYYVCQTTKQYQSVFGSDRLAPQHRGWNKIIGWQICQHRTIL